MAPISASVWRRVRRTITAGMFGVATVAGIGVGLQGASVSPVAPVAVVQAVPAPAPDGAPVHHRGQH